MVWAALGVSLLAVAVTIWQGWLSKRGIGREATDRKAQLELLRAQAQSDAEERAEQRRAYVSVDQTAAQGGAEMDLYTFDVTNAGPATVRHLQVRVHTEAALDVAFEKVEPHVLRSGERGVARLLVPRELRQTPLSVVVEWVDPEQVAEWDRTGTRKTRSVGSVKPVP